MRAWKRFVCLTVSILALFPVFILPLYAESNSVGAVAEVSSGAGMWLETALLPSAIFLGAVIVGYLLGRKYKRK
jgi:hypothetical protein